MIEHLGNRPRCYGVIFLGKGGATNGSRGDR
jgi:hypothetical protein